MSRLRHKIIGGLAGTLALAGASVSQAAPVPTDFVFMIDASASMSGRIASVRNGFGTFATNLDANAVDARFAIVVFGGASELILDFTSDKALVQSRLNQITIGPNAGIQNNHNHNPEAGLEAIRMVLGAAPNSELDNNNIPEDGFLNFRGNARKNLILATDEDSDNPFHAVNRFPGQPATLGSDPPANIAGTGWQDEVDATAAAVIQSQAYLNLLINIGDTPSRSQYGDYTKDVSDPNLLNFNESATLANLLADSARANSLQAQVLGAGLVARTFDVNQANNATFVNNFFAAKLEEVTMDPGLVPEPSAIALVGFGLFGLAVVARRRAS